MNTRSELYRQRQAMRQRIRALVVARRLAAATVMALAEPEPASSAEEPAS